MGRPREVVRLLGIPEDAEPQKAAVEILFEALLKREKKMDKRIRKAPLQSSWPFMCTLNDRCQGTVSILYTFHLMFLLNILWHLYYRPVWPQAAMRCFKHFARVHVLKP